MSHSVPLTVGPCQQYCICNETLPAHIELDGAMTVVSCLDIRPYPLKWAGGADKGRKAGRCQVPLVCIVSSVGNPTNYTESAREERNWYV
jgi:hypothetical protein